MHDLRDSLVDIAIAEGNNLAAQTRSAALAQAQTDANVLIQQRVPKVSDRLYESQSPWFDVNFVMAEDYRPAGEYFMWMGSSNLIGRVYATPVDDPSPYVPSPNPLELPFDLAPRQNALNERTRQVAAEIEAARRLEELRVNSLIVKSASSNQVPGSGSQGDGYFSHFVSDYIHYLNPSAGLEGDAIDQALSVGKYLGWTAFVVGGMGAVLVSGGGVSATGSML